MVLTLDALLRGAARTADVSALDASDPLVASLGHAVTAEQADRPLTREGRRMMYEEWRRLLVQRAALRSQPVGDAGTLRGVLVVGLPRSGTTFLHDQLARAGFGTPTLAGSLVPSGSAPEQAEAERLHLFMMRRLSPELLELHPMGGGVPEECITLMQLTGWSEKFLFEVDAPAQRRWMEEQDPHDAYREHLDLVAGLLPSPVVLKAPSHLGHLALLHALAPGLAVVWVHRSPALCMASFLRLLRAIRTVTYGAEAADAATAAESDMWVRHWGRHAARGVEALADLDVVHVDHERLVEAPATVIDRILAELGEETRPCASASRPPTRPSPPGWAPPIGLDVAGTFPSYLELAQARPIDADGVWTTGPGATVAGTAR